MQFTRLVLAVHTRWLKNALKVKKKQSAVLLVDECNRSLKRCSSLAYFLFREKHVQFSLAIMQCAWLSDAVQFRRMQFTRWIPRPRRTEVPRFSKFDVAFKPW